MADDKQPFDFKKTYADDPEFRRKVDAGRRQAQQKRDDKARLAALKRIAQKR